MSFHLLNPLRLFACSVWNPCVCLPAACETPAFYICFVCLQCETLGFYICFVCLQQKCVWNTSLLTFSNPQSFSRCSEWCFSVEVMRIERWTDGRVKKNKKIKNRKKIKMAKAKNSSGRTLVTCFWTFSAAGQGKGIEMQTRVVEQGRAKGSKCRQG